MVKDKIDEKILEALKVIKAKKNEIEALEKENRAWKTNCSISIGNQTLKNIQTAPKELLVSIVAELLQKEAFIKQANHVLGMENVQAPVYDGFKIDDWMEDCIKRLNIIDLKRKKEELASLEKRLNGIVSNEQRRQIEIEEISKALNI